MTPVPTTWSAFYALLDKLERNIGGARRLADCSGQMHWPQRGVYFFRERSEDRSDTGSDPRIVRVGTHALKDGSGTKLWTRLSQHKGHLSTGGGNSRGSIFRLIVGAALIARDGHAFPTWGVGNTAKSYIRKSELHLEREVSRVIGEMPFLWLSIEDEAGPGSLRGYIERHSIAPAQQLPGTRRRRGFPGMARPVLQQGARTAVGTLESKACRREL